MKFNKANQTWEGRAFEVEEVEHDFALKQFIIYDLNSTYIRERTNLPRRSFFAIITPEDLDDQEQLRNALALQLCTIEEDEGSSITLF